MDPNQFYPKPFYYNPYLSNPKPYYGQNLLFDNHTPIPGKKHNTIELKDYGPDPLVVDIEDATKQNNNFRMALWTGNHFQVTLMSIGVGEDIGLEMHPDVDQFLRIEEGQGLVRMGDRQDRLDFQKSVKDDFAIIIPAGKWHNLINTGNIPIKLYSIYAPPEHPWGTVHKTKAESDEAHHH